jgi:hemin uptake protein HemP
MTAEAPNPRDPLHIEHRGALYRPRQTALGKPILTK